MHDRDHASHAQVVIVHAGGAVRAGSEEVDAGVDTVTGCMTGGSGGGVHGCVSLGFGVSIPGQSNEMEHARLCDPVVEQELQSVQVQISSEQLGTLPPPPPPAASALVAARKSVEKASVGRIRCLSFIADEILLTYYLTSEV
ncbi:hypothetical protein HY412_01740 [Candidatus Kaiserbacteria bacterium]|nr:hypothetical protein [Candidatus Kaiserbacteria bacterium]